MNRLLLRLALIGLVVLSVRTQDLWAGHRAAVNPRFPVPQASYKLRSEGNCGDVDPACWEKLSQASIFVRRTAEKEPLFSRKPGFTCEECISYCLSARDNEGNPCRAAVFDHRTKVCDLFNVDGQTPTHMYHIARHPGRDYFKPLRNAGCKVSGGDTRSASKPEDFLIEPVDVEQIQPEEKEDPKTVSHQLSNPLVDTFALGVPLPPNLPSVPGLGSPVGPFAQPGLIPSGQPSFGLGSVGGFGPPGVDPFTFGGQINSRFGAGGLGVAEGFGPVLQPSQLAGFNPAVPLPLPPQPPPPAPIAPPPPAPVPPPPPPPPPPAVPAARQSATDRRPPPPRGDYGRPSTSFKVSEDKNQCNYDANCWEQRIGCSISNGYLFRRLSGVSCGQCVRICNDHYERKDHYVCKAVRYDHKFNTCDLFSDAQVVVGGPTDLRFPDVAGKKDGNSDLQCYRRIPNAKCGPDGSFVVPPPFSPAAKLSQTREVCPPGIDGVRQVPRFLKYADKDLNADSYVVLATPGVNAAKCLETCNDAQSDKKCRSFDFHADFGCELNLEKEGDSAQLIEKKGSTYYEKTCLPESAEATNLFWVVHPQKLLLGFARAVVDAPTMRECQISCLQATQNFGFPCRSLMYYREEGLNCILNSDTRLTRPDNFIDEGIAEMVYIDVPLAGDPTQEEQQESVVVADVSFDEDGWSPWSECEDGFHVRHQKCDEPDQEECPREFLACPKLEFKENGFTDWSDCEEGFMTRYQNCDSENKFRCPKEHIICFSPEEIDIPAQ